MDPRNPKHNPNERLRWDILKLSHLNGYHTYDFGGAGKTNENSGEPNIKAKFGGKLVFFWQKCACTFTN